MSTDRDYLQSVNIIPLQAAARMAGLRWKSGAPGYDKAGIIDKLLQYPSILRATIAGLQRMQPSDMSQPPRPLQAPSLLDDIAEELENEAPARDTDLTPVSEPAKIPQAGPDLTPCVVVLEQRVSGLEETSETLQNIAGKHQKSLTALAASLAELEKAKPVQFNFPERAPVVIDPKDHHASYPRLLTYLQINRRVILTGSAGTGKSMAVKNAAAALGVKFYLLPPVTMTHELIGHRDAQGNFHDTPLTLAYKHGGLILMDEADASLPDALLCANPIFDGNGFATFGDGNLYEQHPDFLAVFNMNTDGNGGTMQYAGRNRLDGATLARFGVRIHWEVDARIEKAMSGDFHLWYAAVLAVRDYMASREIVDVNATPRHTKTGAALLAAGCPKSEVLADVLKSGALSQSWADVAHLPAVVSFLRS